MDQIYSKNRLAIIFLTIFIFLILYLQTNISLWRGHLEIDVYVFFQRAESFLKHNSFAFLKDNEHLPGTLLFFLSPLIFFWQKFTYGSYLESFILINFGLISLHLALYKQQGGIRNLIYFLIIILISGPILLFRFELFVSLLVILTIIFWQKKRFFLAFLILGLVTTVKIYPILLLPYLFCILFKNKLYKKMFISIASFLMGIFFIVGVFFLMGGNLQKIITSLEFHSQKPVSIESIPGSFITAASLIIDKKPPFLIGGYGVWGIKTELFDFKPVFFNWFWILPLGIFYIYLFCHNEFNQKLKVGVIFWMILLFLVFSKNLHPQYIFWFITLLPLLKIKKEGNIDFLILFGFISIIALLNQCVYPLLYTDFIKIFYYNGQQIEIFFLQLLRNLAILALLIVSFKNIFIEKTIE